MFKNSLTTCKSYHTLFQNKIELISLIHKIYKSKIFLCTNFSYLELHVSALGLARSMLHFLIYASQSCYHRNRIVTCKVLVFADCLLRLHAALKIKFRYKLKAISSIRRLFWALLYNIYKVQVATLTSFSVEMTSAGYT